MEAPQFSRSHATYVKWTIYVTLFTLFSVAGSFSPGLLWGLASFVLAITFVVLNTWSAISSFASHRIARGVWPLVEMGPGLVAIFLIFYYVGDYVHLAVLYQTYRAEVVRSPLTQHRFSWGGYGFVGSAQGDRVLVYSAEKPVFDRSAYIREVGGTPPSVEYRRLTESFWVEETNY